MNRLSDSGLDLSHNVDKLVSNFQSGRISRREFIKRALALGLSASGAGALLAACVPVVTPAAAPGAAATPAPAATATTAAAAPAEPTGSVRFLIAENFWADWEPYQSSAQSQSRLSQHIYDRLIERATADVSQVNPGLAKSWQQLDELTWEFALQEGVKFHNGQEFTADDVKASIELASGATEIQTVLAGVWVPTTVEVVDKYTVRLKTATPFGPFLDGINQTDIVSATDLKAGGDALKKQANGTGPFRVVTDEPTRKVMEAFPDYWRGAAQIKELTWEFIQDPQTRLNALLAGQAHAIDRVPPEHLQVISASPDLALASVTGIENVNLWCRPGRSELWDTNQKYREAAAWSIDREALVRDLVQGASKVSTSFLPELALYHASQSPAYTRDVEKAKALLAEAGQPDGGPEFELWAATGFLPRAKEVTEAIAAQMSEVGFKPKIVTSDVAGVIDDIFSDTGTGLMYHLSWSSSGDPHAALQALTSVFVWNAGDTELDELAKKGAETTDQAGRQAVYEELQAHIWSRVPHVPLYNSDFTIAHTKTLQGLRVLPNFTTYFYPASLST